MLDLNLQNLVFSLPDRMALMNYVPKSDKKIKIGIYRNHSFELIEHIIKPYLDYANLNAEFIYSDYDDSLSFFDLDLTTDCLILWLDVERYHTNNFDAFLKERIEELKKVYKKPVLVALLGRENIEVGDQVINFSFDSYYKEFGERMYDLRLEPFSGTKLAAKVSLKVAKELGLKYIPALVEPCLKAVVLDLDNTLYKGVLGEDGYKDIDLTSGHKKLQQWLKNLKNQGFFLCVVSKNEQKDVLKMFENRKDFPLSVEDFSVIMCSWDNKSVSIQSVAKKLNIGMDSILFVDDNPGELMQVCHEIPNMKFLLAQENAENTLEMLQYYPGLKKIKNEYEDSIRTADAQANEKRNELKSKLNMEDYIRSLKIELYFDIDNMKQISRVSELANKTNQFIFNYKRYSVSEVEDLMQRSDAVVVAVKLSDCLSDSGIICVCVAEKKVDYVDISECFVSCRALGRGIDEIIVNGAIETARQKLGFEQIHVNFQKGARNLPAEKYVEQNLINYCEKPEKWSYRFPEGLVEIKKGE